MPTIIKRNPVDETVRIFNSFYNVRVDVNAADYDIVYSYFFGISKNSEIAGNFTGFFFRIAKEANINVRELLDLIKGKDNSLEMNKVISYYLNALKSKTSLYGISNIPKPNVAVQRNVVI